VGIKGKEPRKAAPSAEGTLGVEGMERECLERILAPYSVDSNDMPGTENPLSKLILAQKFVDGDSIKIDVNNDEITFEKV